MAHEIILLDDVKPALEWVNGRVLQKMSPKPKHSFAQGQFMMALGTWAHHGRRGMVGTEWHFQVRPQGEISRTLVPDVAFLSFERMPFEELESNEIPRIAPDVVIEVRSPDDQEADIEDKVQTYLKAGTLAVFLVDPELKIVAVRDARGHRIFASPEAITHEALPGFAMEARTLFELPRPEPET